MQDESLNAIAERKALEQLHADLVDASVSAAKFARTSATARTRATAQQPPTGLDDWAQIIAQIINAILGIIMAIETTDIASHGPGVPQR